MSDSMLGHTLGQYVIDAIVASGPNATVYEGRHPALGRKVAIKVLNATGPRIEEITERFLREGKFIARLRHSNIVHVYDLAADNGTPYLAMEFVEGKPLRELVEQQGHLEPVAALEIARQVSDALAAAHAQSIIHRDIKPDNIMVDDHGSVKMMDFGIAKDLDEDSGLTQVGASIGTRYYMSPEQVKGGQLDHRTDIYSLGVVLFEMLTGRLPYSPNLSFVDYMTRIVEGPFPSPQVINPQITETVERIVLRMTATNPDERYQTALDLADDIRFCLRVRAYQPGSQAEAEAIASNPFKRLIARVAASGPRTERATVQRRRQDRERDEEYQALKADAGNRYKDGRHFRRLIVRRNCKANVYLDCRDPRRTNLHSAANGRLLDLSSGGASFFVRNRLEKHSRHVVELQFGHGQSITAPVEVCWRRRFDALNAFATGVEFVDMPEADRERLAAILAELGERSGF